MQSRRALHLGLTAVAGIGLLAAYIVARDGSVPTTATVKGPYVALGDSYTSGPGIPDHVGTPVGCQRSDHNYPALLARHLGLETGRVHDVSCSGATISNLVAPQDTGNGTNPPQLAALTAATALVTLGIGGNDVDFAAIMTRCVALDAPGTLIDLVRGIPADRTPCRSSYTAGGTDQIQQKIQAVGIAMANALVQIRQRAPHARIKVVGYPDLLPAGGTTCARALGITPADVNYLNHEEMSLNTLIQQHAQAAGDSYVDTYTPSVGHDACSDQATRWIEPLMPNGAAQLHPNARGQQGMAAAVEKAISSAS